MKAILARDTVRSVALGAAGGLALGASAPPAGSVIAAFVFGAALMFACEPFVASRNLVAAGRTGFVAGLGFGAMALTWVATAIQRFAHYGPALAWAGTVATITLEALAPAVACALYVALARGRTSPVFAAMSVAIGFEFVPMLFPWRPIAMALPSREMAQWLAIGGPALADFALALPACLLVSGAMNRRALHASAGVLAGALVFGVGAARLGSLEAPKPTLRVAVIQPNVSLSTGLDRHQRRARLDRLRDATRRLATSDVDVVLWPESAHPYVFERSRTTDLPSRSATGAPAGTLVVAGVMTQRSACARWNGVLAILRGRVVGRVDKQRRMPFGDYLPFRSGCRDLRPAEALRPLAAASDLGALLCYDEVEPGPARERARGGARWLAGFTNDAWYDETQQPWLHERMARMRAVETGRDLVRAVNTGLSAWIRPDGRVVVRLREGAAGHLVVDVPLRTAITPYVRVGNTFGWLFVVLALASLLDQRRRKTSGGGGR